MPERVLGYDLDLPTPGHVCVSVMRVSGDDAVTRWTQVCARAGVPTVATSYTEAQLQAISSVLTSTPGVLSTVGRALEIRLRTYRTLTTLANRSPASPAGAPPVRSTR